MRPSAGQLEQVAAGWLGTPWCANSAAKGPMGGVACHNLPRAILVEAGWLPETFPVVEGDPNSTQSSEGSVIARWLDGRQEFARVPVTLSLLKPGDLIGIRIRRQVDHLGLCLGGVRFIHVLKHKKAAIDRVTDPTWGVRILAVWRPT